MEPILFKNGQDEIALYPLDSTKLAGRSFLLVSDVSQGDGYCYILEEISTEGKEVTYTMVEDNQLLDNLASIFAEQSEDFDIEF